MLTGYLGLLARSVTLATPGAEWSIGAPRHRALPRCHSAPPQRRAGTRPLQVAARRRKRENRGLHVCPCPPFCGAKLRPNHPLISKLRVQRLILYQLSTSRHQHYLEHYLLPASYRFGRTWIREFCSGCRALFRASPAASQERRPCRLTSHQLLPPAFSSRLRHLHLGHSNALFELTVDDRQE